MTSLTNAQIKELKEAFDLFDRDKSGLIDAKELRSLFQELEVDIPDEEFNIIFKQMDRNGDGNIRFDEFAKAMTGNLKQKDIHNYNSFKLSNITLGSKAYSAYKKADLLATFKRFDKDNSGFLTADEVFNVMKNFRSQVTKEECKNLIKTFDKDKDGKLKYEEFIELFK